MNVAGSKRDPARRWRCNIGDCPRRAVAIDPFAQRVVCLDHFAASAELARSADPAVRVDSQQYLLVNMRVDHARLKGGCDGG